MIRIYKDKDTKVVTKGAYEQFYKPLGYNLVLDVQEEIKEIVENKVEELIVPSETVTKPRRGSSSKKNKRED